MATGGQTGGRLLSADVEAPSEVVEVVEVVETLVEVVKVVEALVAAIAAVLRAVLVVVGWTPPSNEVSFHQRPRTPTHCH